MPKNNTRLVFLPQSIEMPISDDDEELVIGDDGQQMEDIYSQLVAESLLVEMLSKLSDREKIFLLYQILSMFGYSISQERFAKTLSISRVNYINKLSDLKSKIKIFLYANKRRITTL